MHQFVERGPATLIVRDQVFKVFISEVTYERPLLGAKLTLKVETSGGPLA